MRDVAGESFVTQPRELAATLHDRLMTIADAAGFQPRIVPQARQINGLLALVTVGLGMALVPETMRAVHLGGIHYVPLIDPLAHLLLAVASRSGDSFPVLAQFLATVEESVRELGTL